MKRPHAGLELVLPVVAALVAAGCGVSSHTSGDAGTGSWFEEVAQERGLVFAHRSGHESCS